MGDRMALSRQEVKRLALIRFLYTQGVEQATRPQPLCSQALLSYQDAVEMFLQLAAEHLNVSLEPFVPFDEYFTKIQKVTRVELPSRRAMHRMNKSRVNLKHYGSIPSTSDLEQFRADVTTFLTDATQMVFAADFASLDMIDLVTQQSTLERLREADVSAAQGKYQLALMQLHVEFDRMLDDYADRKRNANGVSPYKWWPPQRTRFGNFDSKSAAQADVAVVAAIVDMQRALRVLAMGLDYQRYTRFELLTPLVPMGIEGGRLRYGPIPEAFTIGDDEYEFCRQFVIEAALHLAKMDFDLDVRSALKRAMDELDRSEEEE
jgi:hypothetical protein